MRAKKYIIMGIMGAMVLVSSGCAFPEILSADDYIATEVADSLEEALEEIATAEVQATYTPYPTYTPAPTYTPQPYYYSFEYNAPPEWPDGPQDHMPPMQPMPRR